jgi:CubicO group peptidase (beta-lactamase class C family)
MKSLLPKLSAHKENINTVKTKLFTALPLVFCVLGLTSCNTDSKLNFDEFVEREITEFLVDENAQAASFVMVTSNRTYQRHFGQFSDGSKPNNETIYELASITKTYTGLLLAKAILDNKLTLDDDIRIHLGTREFANLQYANTPITIRDLVTHRSALPQEFAFTQDDIKKGTALALAAKYSKAQFFEDLAQYKLDSKPGENYQYSNIGTNLNGYILEKVYNKPLSSLITQLITDNSGEKYTRLSEKSTKNYSITMGTDSEGNIQPLLSPYSFADGGITSTSGSISQYMQYLLSSSAEEISLSRSLIDGSKTMYGKALYWNTYKYESANPVFYQSGGSIGTSSWLALYPEQDLGIFIVTNLVAGDTQGKLSDIANDIIEKYEDFVITNQRS